MIMPVRKMKPDPPDAYDVPLGLKQWQINVATVWGWEISGPTPASEALGYRRVAILKRADLKGETLYLPLLCEPPEWIARLKLADDPNNFSGGLSGIFRYSTASYVQSWAVSKAAPGGIGYAPQNFQSAHQVVSNQSGLHGLGLVPGSAYPLTQSKYP
jgi:hypothetical protein